MLPIAGSSPRLRGTPGACGAPRSASRFIPAPAGNSRYRRTACAWTPVHPRACGELVLTPLDGPAQVWRFIPAPAGNSHKYPGQLTRTVVGSSPRLRGTRRYSPRRTVRVSHLTGSSPRLRGTRTGRAGPAGCASVHPRACGELRRKHFGQSGDASVHPRACGELSVYVHREGRCQH